MDGLQGSALLASLPSSALQVLAGQSHLRVFESGQILCHQFDVAHTVWLVMDGWLKLTRETLDGGEAVWDVVGEGTIIGLETLLSPFKYPTRVVGVTQGALLAMPHGFLRSQLEAHPAFAVALLGHHVKNNHNDRLEMEHRSHQTAPQRIGCFLLRFVKTPLDGEASLELPFDKSLLAALLGMQPETFSRALSRLKDEAGLQLHGPRIFISDVRALQKYVCGGCSGIYPCHGK